MKELLTFPKIFGGALRGLLNKQKVAATLVRQKLFGSIGLKQNRIAFTKA